MKKRLRLRAILPTDSTKNEIVGTTAATTNTAEEQLIVTFLGEEQHMLLASRDCKNYCGVPATLSKPS